MESSNVFRTVALPTVNRLHDDKSILAINSLLQENVPQLPVWACRRFPALYSTSTNQPDDVIIPAIDVASSTQSSHGTIRAIDVASSTQSSHRSIPAIYASTTQIGHVNIPCDEITDISETGIEEKDKKQNPPVCLVCDCTLDNAEDTIYNFHHHCLQEMAEAQLVSLTTFPDESQSSVDVVVHAVGKGAVLAARLSLATIFGIVQTIMAVLEDWI